MPRLSPPPNERARRKTLWTELNQFVLSHGGWIVSSDNAWPVRIESPDYDLIEAVEQAGYTVVDLGSVERFLPCAETVRINATTTVKRDQLVPVECKLFRVTLPP